MICDANPEKDGLVTPGVNIPIVSKDVMRKEYPDYLFVLIWHFRNEVLHDEYDFIMNGGTMIFPLPRLHFIYDGNYDKYLNADFEDLAFSL
jgi:NDP-4-keto-2,6-dideoxyhexose 3-C-methyltransferase